MIFSSMVSWSLSEKVAFEQRPKKELASLGSKPSGWGGESLGAVQRPMHDRSRKSKDYRVAL